MKKIMLLLAFCQLFVVSITLAQYHNTHNEPVYYVQGTVINRAYFDFIKPDSIKEIHVIKTDDKHPNGAIYITLNNPEYLKRMLADRLLSIKDILRVKGITVKSKQPVIYVWNDKLLTDTANVRVPESYLRSVRLTPAVNMPYFKTALPNTSVVTIITGVKGEKIMIRGAEASR
ncbi:hypothetical protein LJ707_16880 [Mucilaginibacter sp. UR6-1]|uniref:hypothetical protein n=1 Tax=Mucilaginibacter sp. UR6-1 TaxID=1435643 RepID=UPI001E4377B0|nr:hypothetical protein [Mucilaginibacter sp. UR6-1]MCC8410620.1 hypothetical protein [Mucilaginibacter sp. UR6-1]